MEIRIRLTSYDLMNHQTAVLADGVGVLLGDTLFYSEKDHPDIRHEIAFQKDRILLKRNAEIQSETRLPYSGESGMSRITSLYGVMELEARLDDSFRSEQMWMAEYRILENEEVITHQKLVWELKGVLDE